MPKGKEEKGESPKVRHLSEGHKLTANQEKKWMGNRNTETEEKVRRPPKKTYVIKQLDNPPIHFNQHTICESHPPLAPLAHVARTAHTLSLLHTPIGISPSK